MGKRKIHIIVLILALFTPFIATHITYKYQQYSIRKKIKHEIIEGLTLNQLVKLTFKKSEVDKLLKWEHSKEFEYNRNMFDVVKSEPHNDSITYYCWPDNEETSLNKNLTKLTQLALGSDPVNQKNASHFKTFLKGLYFKPIIQIGTKLYNFTNIAWGIKITNYINIILSPLTNPPRIG